MDTERNAFVGSLANFTGIYKIIDNDSLIKRELTDKNILFIKALISLAMYEGNYLGSSWKSVLRVISMINYYHNFGNGMGIHGDFQEESSPTKYDAETEIIKKQNSARLASEIDESDIDKIFVNSVNLGPVGIIDFINDMCSVSEEELDNYSSPRTFMLQKLVEVADLNMDRVRVEFSNMWKEIGNHLSKYGQNKNKRIAEYTVDSLRQLAKKFLEKTELENFHFQKDFLEPFRTIMLGSYSTEGLEDIRHFILTCMCLFSQQKLKSIKSGWEIIFDIFKLAAGDESKDLFSDALQAMKFLLQKENFDVVEEYFNKILD